MIKSLSLFSGCGGLDCGMEKAGFRPMAFADFDPVCRESLGLNYPSVPCFTNVFDPEIPAFFLKNKLRAIYGGPPCQPFSTMGKRRYFNDDRGKALLQYVHLITTLFPDVFLMENVQGLAIADDGGLLRHLESKFHKAGYKTAWKVVNAADYGVPQSRKRLVMMGSLKRTIEFPDIVTSTPTLRDALEGVDADSEGASFPKYLVSIMSHVPEGGNWRSLPESLRKKAMGNANLQSGGLSGYCRRLSYDRPSPTLLTSPVQRATMLGHPTENRPLNLAEYQRIQCFPDSWKLSGSVPDKYRQLGNAVPVTLAYEMGKILRTGI